MPLTFSDVTADHPLLIRMCTVSRHPRPPRRRPRHDRSAVRVLDRRLRRVAAGIVAAKPNKLIADDMGCTEGTIKVYTSELFESLSVVGSRVESRMELARMFYTMALQELQSRIEDLESEAYEKRKA